MSIASRKLSLGAFVLTSTVSFAASAQQLRQQQANVWADDVDGAKMQSIPITSIQIGATCEARLQYLPTPGGWEVKEVSGDRGAPQRLTSATCAAPTFGVSSASDARYEEQTAYYWTEMSRAYAVRRIWNTPPGWVLGPIKMAKDPVQPNVVTQGTFDVACFPIGGADGCMRVWPHEGPKIHVKTGKVTPGIVTHEYGHYAAGFVFGHMDAFGFTLPAAAGDCAKLAFQEALAPMFSALVLHDARYAALGGGDGFAPIKSSQTSRWPFACQNPQDAYTTAAPLEQAFLQALWGVDASRTIKVDWGPVPAMAMPKDPQLANRTMANAFVYALALNRGQRIDQMAGSILEWLTVNEPKRVGEIRRIFAAHGFSPRPAGEACAAHPECMSFRCDARPGAGCVYQDGMAAGGQACTTHQQCQSGLCKITSGIRGTCALTNQPLGTSCASHAECQSQRCDNRPGAGCVAPDGGALSGQFCTTHQQCRAGVCNVTPGRISGTCR